jgi:hypothetical protein
MFEVEAVLRKTCAFLSFHITHGTNTKRDAMAFLDSLVSASPQSTTPQRFPWNSN